MDLRRRHHYSYIDLMELFQGPYNLDNYRRRIGMEHAMVNTSSKIWVFWNKDWHGEVLSDTMQQLSIKFKHLGCQKEIIISAVYVRCNALERLELWEELELMAEDVNIPWIVGGDCNVILHETEKLGGLSVTHHETTDFAQCIYTCGMGE